MGFLFAAAIKSILISVLYVKAVGDMGVQNYEPIFIYKYQTVKFLTQSNGNQGSKY
jgi:hypothetical protein